MVMKTPVPQEDDRDVAVEEPLIMSNPQDSLRESNMSMRNP